MVSGSFDSPSRGSFHRSVALLFSIGRRVVLSLGGWAPRLHTEFHELRATLERRPRQGFRIRVQDCHLLRFSFPEDSACDAFVTAWVPEGTRSGARNPAARQAGRWFGLFRFRSPLLTESLLISFPAGTKMCQFPALASHGLCIQPRMTESGCPVPPGCPIRRSRD